MQNQRVCLRVQIRRQGHRGAIHAIKSVGVARASRRETSRGWGRFFSRMRRCLQIRHRRCRNPEEQIVAALLRQMGWTHFTLLLTTKESLRREVSAEMRRVERWNTRTLQKRIQYIARADRPRALPGRANGRGPTSSYGNAVSSIVTAPVRDSMPPKEGVSEMPAQALAKLIFPAF